MKKAIAITIFLCTALLEGSAQNFDGMDRFKAGASAARTRFAEQSKRNKEKFAVYHDAVWEKFGAKPPISLPEDWKIKPVPYDNKPVTTKDIPVEEVVEPVIAEPVAVPPVKIPDTPVVDTQVQFDFYGTLLSLYAPTECKVSLNNPDNEAISSSLARFDEAFARTAQQCLAIKREYNLCDWAYALLIDKVSKKYFGPGNEATLLMSYLYISSGYRMILARNAGVLYLLFSCDSHLFNKNYFEIDGRRYYVWGEDEPDSLEAVNSEDPDAVDMNMNIRTLPTLSNNPSPKRVLESKKGKISTAVSVNMNLVDFYNDYPRFYYRPDIMTRWAVYANAPLDQSVLTSLYPDLKKQLVGLSRVESLQELLYFVQTSFEYKLDDEVWGEDRPFFAEESLHYDYCDCEDRAILFSHLVRDLLDMDVVLVLYPGHLATAVKVGENVPGDFISLADGSYVICDPTYIGAPIGATMTDMDNSSAKVILLKR